MKKHFLFLLFIFALQQNAAKAHWLWHRSTIKLATNSNRENIKPISLACGQMIHKYKWRNASDSSKAKKIIQPTASDDDDTTIRIKQKGRLLSALDTSDEIVEHSTKKIIDTSQRTIDSIEKKTIRKIKLESKIVSVAGFGCLLLMKKIHDETPINRPNTDKENKVIAIDAWALVVSSLVVLCFGAQIGLRYKKGLIKKRLIKKLSVFSKIIFGCAMLFFAVANIIFTILYILFTWTLFYFLIFYLFGHRTSS